MFDTPERRTDLDLWTNDEVQAWIDRLDRLCQRIKDQDAAEYGGLTLSHALDISAMKIEIAKLRQYLADRQSGQEL